MFFEIELLCRQGKGTFALAWLAATRGMKLLTTKQVLNVNVEKLCDGIRVMVTSSSNRTKERMSLRLSAILINGVIKIYHKQVILFQDDIVDYMHCIQRPLAIKSTGPSKPILAVKTKRKKTVVLSQEQVVVPDVADDLYQERIITDEEVLEALQQIPTAPPSAITLREEMPLRPTRFIEEEPFRSEAEKERQMQILLNGIPLPPAEPDITATQDISLARLQITDKRQDRPHKLARLEIQETAATATNEVPQILLTFPAPTLEQPAPPEILTEPTSAPQEIPSVAVEVVTAEAILEVPTQRKKPKKNRAPAPTIFPKKVYAREKTTQRRHIMRCSDEDDETLNMKVLLNDYSRTYKVCEVDEFIYDVFSKLRIADAEADELAAADIARAGVSSSSASDLSATLRKIHERHTKSQQTASTLSLAQQVPEQETPMEVDVYAVQPEVQTLEVISRATTPQRPVECAESPQTTPVPLAESTAFLPGVFKKPSAVPCRARTRLSEIEETPAPSSPSPEQIIQQTLEEAVLAAQSEDGHTEAVVSVRSPTESEKRHQSAKERQNAIIEIVKTWNYKERELTLEDVAQKPLIRLNVALAFNDLLFLAMNRYVKLNNKPGSTEIASVEKGPKLLK